LTLGEITPEHVQRAMSEEDELGRAAFLEKYGFGFATNYLLSHEGHFYDPKAVVGVAHGHAESRAALAAKDFDATEAIAWLRRLGFEVVPFNGLWWVNQGQSYRHERDGGYVWAPRTNKNGTPLGHHVAVSKLRVGQRILHNAGGICAVGIVAEQPRESPKPAELSEHSWNDAGYLCRVEYRELPTPIPRTDLPSRGPEVGVFDSNGNAKLGYLFKVEDAALFPLLEFITRRAPQFWDELDPSKVPNLELSRDEIEEDMSHVDLVGTLTAHHNVVLEGVPGTGKSYAVEAMSGQWEAVTGRKLLSHGDRRFLATVMHPSTSYEDFIEGLRPTVPLHDGDVKYFDQPAAGDGQFKVDDGFFLRACSLAAANPQCDVLVLLDEFNRCNVSSVMGDLLLTLEGSKRASFRGDGTGPVSAAHWASPVSVTLPYSRREFFVPSNVYVVATTNTTDRSVAPIDAAIRRRFAFVRLEPDFGPAEGLAQLLPTDSAVLLRDTISELVSLNENVLGPCLGPDALLGHSYAHALHSRLVQAADPGSRQVVADAWRFAIVPQLIDTLRSYGAEELLTPSTRDRWFGDHAGEADADIQAARDALATFDRNLVELGLRVVVEGTGLARGARLVESKPEPGTDYRVDVGKHQSIAVESERQDADAGSA